ncbi:predicted protein [Sclerotinia sclerotiorum 1980 UF-70]|uniref:CCHC-type domain-containing protein n=1 Tax=Sclerotinia sclerotiorum (strain ATCC 18683 / 1980 / Ss-1) TaxID=665079 RepID=A7EUD7_SCLS1|nr:predicted protein [Sclerotinia sclerotiorum 1980 UF-70]EDN93079.1 predicted protein [Sclerotinia sclerotiorum 1980 UF-70]
MSASAGTPTSAPKAMSSRLLTMKFMQRAAAASPTNASPSSLDEPSPKRQKTAQNTPTKFNVDSLADNRAIQAAIEEEEAKKQAALDRAAAEAGDTRWVLSFEGRKNLNTPKNILRVVQTSFAKLDLPSPTKVQHTDDGDNIFGDDKPFMVGRRSFGKFNKVLENPDIEFSSPSEEEESDHEESADEDSEDDPTGAKELIKASKQEAIKRAKEERKAKKKAEKAELLELSKKRKKKHVSLNGLTSLSGSGGSAFGSGGANKSDIKCYTCGGNHIARDCPRPKRKHQGDGGPPRKSQRTK